MFDLETEIRSWYVSLESNDAFCNADVVELESHLRDLIEDLTRSGRSLEMAFRAARVKIGSRKELAREYAKDDLNPFWSVRTVWLLAGLVIVFIAQCLMDIPALATASVCGWLAVPLVGFSKAVAALLVLGVIACLVVLVGRSLLRHGVPDQVRNSRALIIGFPFLVIAFVFGNGTLHVWALGFVPQKLVMQVIDLTSTCATLFCLSIPFLLGALIIRNWHRARTNQPQGDSRVCWLLTGSAIYVLLVTLCNFLSWATISLYSTAGVSRHPTSTIAALMITISSFAVSAWLVERSQRRRATFARRIWVQLLAVLLASLVAFWGTVTPRLVGPIWELDSGLYGQLSLVRGLSTSLLTLSALVLLTVCSLRLRPHSSGCVVK